MKWEPVAAMVGVMLLGVWLVAGGQGPRPERPNAYTYPFQVANSKGVVEIVKEPEPTFRVMLRNGYRSEVMSAGQFGAAYGDAVLTEVVASRANPAFRFLNITSWSSLVWVSVGFVGQLAFFGRMWIQWLVSERSRESVVPEAFWWLSLLGGITLFSYFAWRQDLIGVLGQTSGVVIYARNIRLIRKKQRRDARQKAREAAAFAPVADDSGAPEPELATAVESAR